MKASASRHRLVATRTHPDIAKDVGIVSAWRRYCTCRSGRRDVASVRNMDNNKRIDKFGNKLLIKSIRDKQGNLRGISFWTACARPLTIYLD